MLYKEVLTNYISNAKTYLKYSTYTNYYNIIINHIMPKLGDYEIEKIDDDILQQFILDQLKNGRLDTGTGISNKFAKDIITVLKLTLDNHDVKIQLPYAPPKKIEIFTKENQIILMNFLQHNINHKNFGILLCIHTGIRIGELCSLQWKDINFSARLLYINKTMIRTYTKEDGSILEITPPKTRSSIRNIPLNSWIMQYANLLKGDDDCYILTNTKKWIEPDKYRLYYNSILRKLNLPHLKFHSLRHTFATRCIECGCDYKSLSELLGHSNVAITMNIYVHPQMELKRKCVELLVDYYH